MPPTNVESTRRAVHPKSRRYQLAQSPNSKWYGLRMARQKCCTGHEGNASGAKALIRALGTARLKSCPDTKHESFGGDSAGRLPTSPGFTSSRKPMLVQGPNFRGCRRTPVSSQEPTL